MQTDRIYLRENDPDVYLDYYTAAPTCKPRDAVLICPGGAYEFVCDEREGEPIALRYLAAGYQAFVLTYSVGSKAVFPRPLTDAALAMGCIRSNAERFGIDPARVFVVGFSAGGHLAASLGTLWDLPILEKETGRSAETIRPTGMILGYPVISGISHPHAGSFRNLLGEESPSTESLTALSLETRVKNGVTVPAFLFHTFDDPTVPVENSLVFAAACSREKVSVELHLFPHGPHGIALANEWTSCGIPAMIRPDVATWLDLSVRWAHGIK